MNIQKLLSIIAAFLIYYYSYAQNDYVIAPSINSDKVVKSNIWAKSDFSRSFKYLHMSDWAPGMKFIVIKGEYESNSEELSLSKYKKNKKILKKDFNNKIFEFVGFEERQVSCPRGKCTRTYLIFTCENEKYEYEYFDSKEELAKSDAFARIDKLTYLNDIDVLRNKFIGKEVYILTGFWRPLDEQIKRSAAIQKFVPVVITNVGLPTTESFGNIRMTFKFDYNEYYIDTWVSGINYQYKIDETYFDNIFSFTDPKTNYPNISDEAWALIKNNKVKIGMTEQECRLSWGMPYKINKQVSDASNSSQWVYNGILNKGYLYFTNGILKTIQN